VTQVLGSETAYELRVDACVTRWNERLVGVEETWTVKSAVELVSPREMKPFFQTQWS
jgi:hypothetical protein